MYDDPYFDFFLGMPGEGEMGGLTHKIVEWLVGLALLKMVESSGVMVFLVNVHLYILGPSCTTLNLFCTFVCNSYVSPLDPYHN